jgi:spore coat polysaccharide biosynthesis protein SpsF (cytidylyltransferase family)
MKNAILVTVRTGSSRLPKKCLLEINQVKVIEFLLRRLRRSRRADGIIVCTTDDPADTILCEIAQREQVHHFRGSVTDKLERWRGACVAFGVENVVTADGDDPFCEPRLIDLGFAQIAGHTVDFIEADGLACGAFTYAFTHKALEKVCAIKGTTDTEMMSVYFKETGLFRLGKLQDVPPVYFMPEVRATLDYPEDFAFFKTVIEEFYKLGKIDFELGEILDFLRAHPEVVRINAHRQAEFTANQAAKTKLVLRSET